MPTPPDTDRVKWIRSFVRRLPQAVADDTTFGLVKRFVKARGWEDCKQVALPFKTAETPRSALVREVEGTAAGRYVSKHGAEFKVVGLEHARQIAWVHVPPQPLGLPRTALVAWRRDQTDSDDLDDMASFLQLAAFTLCATDASITRNLRFRTQLARLKERCSDLRSKASDPNRIETFAPIRKLAEAVKRNGFSGETPELQFEDFVLDVLDKLFESEFANATKQQPLHGDLKRIDIVFRNTARSGFFHDLACRHTGGCPYIIVECKHLRKAPVNPEVDQLLGRFAEGRGRLGLLVCYRIKEWDRPRLLERCREAARDGRGWIIALATDDLLSMIDARTVSDDELWDLLDDHFRLIAF